MSALRRIRGLLGFGVISAVAWIPLGWGASIGFALARGQALHWQRFTSGIPELAITGFVCGLISAAVLAAAERRRSVADLSYIRMGIWGLLRSEEHTSELQSRRDLV